MSKTSNAAKFLAMELWMKEQRRNNKIKPKKVKRNKKEDDES